MYWALWRVSRTRLCTALPRSNERDSLSNKAKHSKVLNCTVQATSWATLIDAVAFNGARNYGVYVDAYAALQHMIYHLEMYPSLWHYIVWCLRTYFIYNCATLHIIRVYSSSRRTFWRISCAKSTLLVLKMVYLLCTCRSKKQSVPVVPKANVYPLS